VKQSNALKLTVFVTVLALQVLPHSALAATDANVVQVENFIRSVIQVIAGIAGLVATVFIVIGGLGYITSSGNPEHLTKAKSTLLWAAIGLAITIGAFVLSNIVTDLATSAFGS
jgi:hypothetical protein